MLGDLAADVLPSTQLSVHRRFPEQRDEAKVRTDKEICDMRSLGLRRNVTCFEGADERRRIQMGLLYIDQGPWCCVAGIALLSSMALAQSQSCPNNDTGLTLPAGFCATVFADGIGHARHLVLSPNGSVYVNTWSGRYYGNDVPHAGG